VVLALQPLVSRETSPVDSAVVSVSRFNTGGHHGRLALLALWAPCLGASAGAPAEQAAPPVSHSALCPTPPHPTPPHPTARHPGPGAPNVIPDGVDLAGTLRAFNADTFARLRRRIEEVANGTAAAAGCAAAGWTWSPRPYPPLINDAGLAEVVAGAARRLAAAAAAEDAARRGEGESGGSSSGSKGSSSGSGGSTKDQAAAGRPRPLGGGNVRYEHLAEPTLAAEDFAIYTTEGGIPAAFAFLAVDSTGGESGAASGGGGDGVIGGGGGGGEAGRGVPPALHTARFTVEESRLGLGAALHAANALAVLWGGGGGGGGGGQAAAASRDEL
jgi:metal-dependent amidase/aminoacylase/carboxypeptidase family protein